LFIDQPLVLGGKDNDLLRVMVEVLGFAQYFSGYIRTLLIFSANFVTCAEFLPAGRHGISVSVCINHFVLSAVKVLKRFISFNVACKLKITNN
jgi:hypothetical protein